MCAPPMKHLILVFIVALGLSGQFSSQSALAVNEQVPDSELTNGVDTVAIAVMSLNLGNGLVVPEDLVSYLRVSEFDLVSLLEVTSEMAAALETDVSDIFPYREIRGGGIPGKALLSRYPITNADWLELNPGRPDLIATVDLDGQLIQVLVAHPPPPEISWYGVRQREGTVEQFDRLIEIAAEAEYPFLLVGDLNIVSVQKRYRELEDIGLQDVYSMVGNGPGATFPKRIPPLSDNLFLPAVRIDYIWASEDWQVISSSTGEDIGSDHLPIIAHLELGSAIDQTRMLVA